MVGSRRIVRSSFQRSRFLLGSAAALSLTTVLVLPTRAVAATTRPSLAFLGLHQQHAHISYTTTSSAATTRLHSTFANATSNPDMATKMILPYQEGSHNSIKITIPDDASATTNDDSSSSNNNLLFDRSTFRQHLDATIAACRQMNKSSIWVQVPMSRASLMEKMVGSGFTFHHAEGNVANLSLWLLDPDDNKIPVYATHQVGVGAMVVNSKNEFLCVRELRNNFRPWKMPGGLAELGEDLSEAIVREVLEETGVPCRFLSVVSLRHTHNIQFGRSDLYFMCRLEPILGDDGEIPTPVPQAGEIERAEWVPMQEYKDMIDPSAEHKGHPMMRHILDIYEQNVDLQKTVLPSIVPGRKPSPIYHSALILEDEEEDC